MQPHYGLESLEGESRQHHVMALSAATGSRDVPHSVPSSACTDPLGWVQTARMRRSNLDMHARLQRWRRWNSMGSPPPSQSYPPNPSTLTVSGRGRSVLFRSVPYRSVCLGGPSGPVRSVPFAFSSDCQTSSSARIQMHRSPRRVGMRQGERRHHHGTLRRW